MSAWFYILRLKSANLYVGSTTDLEKRYEDHCSGRACRTTTLDPPITLVYSEEYETFGEARRREAQVKRWSRAKKEALIAGDLATLRNLAKSTHSTAPLKARGHAFRQALGPEYNRGAQG